MDTQEHEIAELKAQILVHADDFRRARDQIDMVKRAAQPQMDAAKEALIPLLTRYRELTGNNYADEAGYVQLRVGRTSVEYDTAPILKRWMNDPITYHYVAGAIKLDTKALDKVRKDGASWLDEYCSETNAGEPTLAIK